MYSNLNDTRVCNEGQRKPGMKLATRSATRPNTPLGDARWSGEAKGVAVRVGEAAGVCSAAWVVAPASAALLLPASSVRSLCRARASARPGRFSRRLRFHSSTPPDSCCFLFRESTCTEIAGSLLPLPSYLSKYSDAACLLLSLRPLLLGLGVTVTDVIGSGATCAK